MAYVPADPPDLTAPVVANDADGWQLLIDNDAEVYTEYEPPIVQAKTKVAVTSATYVDVLEWKVPQNEDELVVRIEFRWKVSGGGNAYCECDLTDGSGTDTATSAVFTSATETSGTLNITPSNSAGSATPRTLTLKLKTDAGTVELLAVDCYIVGAAPGTGTLASGVISVHTGWYSAEEPVPSEVAQRMIDNPKRLAQDRPVGLVSILDDISATSGRALYHTDSASGAVLAAFMLPADVGLRKYRIAYRVDRTGGSSHAVTVYLGMYQFPTTATGWTQSTQKIGGELFEALNCVVVGSVAGGGDIFLRSLQVIREPI